MSLSLRPTLTHYRIILAVWVVSTCWSGVVRWFLHSTGLVAAIYLPIMLMTLLLMYLFVELAIKTIKADELDRLTVLVLLVFSILLLFGIFNLPSPGQALFGAYILVPFFIGLVLPTETWRFPTYQIVALWLSAVMGVILNMYLDYPWVGYSYDVGGVSIESSRQWWSNSTVRYAGLARASFDAATQIAALSIIMMKSKPGVLQRLVIYGLSLAAIYFTDSKGMMVAGAISMVIFEVTRLNWWLPYRGIVVSSLMLCLLMPIWGYFFEPRLNAMNTTASLASVEDRLRDMWPRAIDLVVDHGNLLLGRGIGGIGTAQSIFEPHQLNAADNVLVYIFVAGGFMLLGLFLVSCISVVFIQNPIMAALVIQVIVYGSVVNVFENPIMAILLGTVLKYSHTPFWDRVASARAQHQQQYKLAGKLEP
ncbi:MAG: hypothetical protein RLZZ502_1608 [Pseudomonadota bacterium]|jgi:hypothetical protein